MTPITITSRLKQKREALGISQAELARRMTVSRASVSIWESGGNISQDNIVKLAKILRVTPEWLQYGVESMAEVNVPVLEQCLLISENVIKKQKANLPNEQFAKLVAYLYADANRGLDVDDSRVSDLIKMLA
jgi:transcriptional regulator with XRE-family HTH domain